MNSFKNEGNCGRMGFYACIEYKKQATVCLAGVISLQARNKSDNLNEEDALRLQLETHAMSLVIQEVFQPQELDTTQRPPVSPVHCNFQLPGLTHTHFSKDWIIIFVLSERLYLMRFNEKNLTLLLLFW